MKCASLLLVTIATLSACTYRPNPIPLVATSRDELTALQGSWSGEYSGTESGRSGTISFTLRSESDTAHGEVLMVPKGMHSPIQRASEGINVSGERLRPSTEMLTIAFARIRNGEVTGRLDPYRDPSCGCIVRTVFTGTLRDSSTLEGTFITSATGLYTPQHGDWRVKRVTP
jgi:hypothetical protein